MGVYSRTKRLPIRITIAKETNASNTTASIPLWTVQGSVRIVNIGGIVTTALSSNHTAAHFRLNDGTNTPAITAASGTTMSSASAGSMFGKTDPANQPLAFSNASQARVEEGLSKEAAVYVGAVLTAKNGATTNIEYRYTTTNTPASGVIDFFVEFVPMSTDGALVLA